MVGVDYPPGIILPVPVEVSQFSLHERAYAGQPASCDAVLLAEGFEGSVDLLAALQADQKGISNPDELHGLLQHKIYYSNDRFAANTIASSPGKYTCSNEAAQGTGVSGAASRVTGASR